jgi:thiosulfate/3-mercaptopyruvate sulfurtransferase
MHTLITVNELITTQDIVIFDCRHALAEPDYGSQQYNTSHIPNAIFVDLNQQLSARVIPGVTGRHPLPTQAAFAAQVQQWGLKNNQQAVIYDDANGAFAARMWWMLRWLGHDNVAVLDGGFKAWCEMGQPVSQEQPKVIHSEFETRTSLTNTITADDLPGYKGTVTDARDLVRYKGISEPIDPVAGHIPGAVCLPFSNNLTPESRFKSIAELQNQFKALGISDTEGTVCYCGSGVTAAHNILALVHAGYPEPILYPGSFSEWITDPDRPVATDK